MSGQPGAFRVTSNPDARHRVTIEVAYTEDASPDAIRKALLDVITTATAELDKRLTRDNRRRPPAANQ